MRSGKLRHKIAIQHQIETQDETTGEIKVEWQHLKDKWAEILPFSGREFIASQSIQSEVDSKIKMRFDSSITPKMRAVYRDKIYDIQAILQDNKSLKEWQTLLCRTIDVSS